jgi:hypothetical protein
MMKALLASLLAVAALFASGAQAEPRARGLGVPFEAFPGP